MSIWMMIEAVVATDELLTHGYWIGGALLIALICLPALYFAFFADALFADANAPPQFPILQSMLTGQFRMQQHGPLEMVRQGYKQCGDCFRVRLFHRHVTFMIGPEANKLVFEAKDTVLSQKEIYSFTVPVFGPNIVYDAPLKIMQQQLKFVNKGLNHVNMLSHVSKIVMEAEQFFAKWGDSGEVDLMHEFSELIILTASRCLLGEEIRNNVQTEFADLYQTLSDGMTHLSVFAPYLPTPAHRRRDEARAKIKAIFEPIIANRRANPDIKSDDFLQVLVDARYMDDSVPTDNEIVGLLIAALFGGQHTSNITSTWLGLHVHEQKKTLVPRLLAEQKEVLEANGGEVTFEALNQMELLNACMKETLRKYPPLVILMRTAQEPVQYKQYVIPQNDVVAVVPHVSHHLPEIFSNPERFDPDRFMEPRVEDKIKYSFLSFGGGRHGCLGERFAFLQVKTIWSTLLRRFDFELTGPLPPVDYSALVAGPKPPCMIRYKRKSSPYEMSSI